MTAEDYEFPDDFAWGAAAAAYQIEGAARTDGRGESVWDMFCARQGAVFEGHDGSVACDHYHRYPEDVALLQALGVRAYRLSISWPRVLPSGTGQPNARGLDFYDRLVDALLAAGVEPWVTLFHWDFPTELFARGGWLSRDVVEWFGDYAALIGRRLSDRVRHFMPLNEPQVFIGHGHLDGLHAPGLTLPLAQVLRAGHHALLAHGRAVQALRAAAKRPLLIGHAPVGMPRLPASDAPLDVELARRATFEVREPSVWNNAWWMDPVYLGRYPEQALDFYGSAAPPVEDGDMELISQPLDFFGVNIYEGRTVLFDNEAEAGYVRVERALPGAPRTAFGWQVTPEALYWGPRFFYERYGKPVVITENGVSCRDWVSLDGCVHDPTRIDFTTRYLRELWRALRDGVDVRGYFHWSILDNFEWAAGYRERFGLVHVDYETLARTPKDSFSWYKQVIASRGKHLRG
jgi:beta-glucosidase